MAERCDEYEEEWRALRAPRIEDYLRGLDGETQCTLWMELVLIDQELRRGRGETPTLADYRESCPDPVLLVDPSTDWWSRDGDETNGTVEPDGTRGLAAEFGPAADRGIAAWIADFGAMADDAALPTIAPNGHAAGPGDATDTVGPCCDGLDGLTQAQPGAGFGDYELIEPLGTGSMGVVYKARQKRLDRIVALKMIGAGIWAGEEQIRLFRSEARAVAALDHPHIVPVLDSGEHRGILYYSMKLLRGCNLQKCLGRFRNDPAAIARLVARVAEAIDHAHQRGVLHRDIKPSNILIDERGEPHVIDFGLALRLDAAAIERANGHVMGTPGYMPPEQARGDAGAITTAADVYGLGAVLYTLLAGEPPFSGRSRRRVMHDVAWKPTPRPRDRDPRADRDLEIICLKCLNKEPKDRYPSARELADDLNRWLDGRPILARPASRVERAVKWVRRHKLIAALCGAAAIGAIVGVSGLAWGWSTAVAAREKAEQGEDVALRLAYAATLNLAERDWRDVNVAHMLRRLEEVSPPQGKPDLRGFEWYYLDRLARAQGRTLEGHAGVVKGVAYSPDGGRIASASWDRTIRIWDAATGRVIRAAVAAQPVHAVAFHPDGARLASAGTKGELILWDAGTGQTIRSLLGHDPARLIEHVAFSRDGKTLASTSEDGTIKLWDVDTGKLIRSLEDHPVHTVGEIAFGADGRTLLSIAGSTPVIRIWDVAGGGLIRTIQGDGTAPFTCLAIRPDGKMIATGARAGKIQLRDAATGSVVRELADFHNPHIILSLAFSRDGKALASASFMGHVAFWDVSTGSLVRTIRGHSKAVYDVAFSPDGVHLASASADGTVKLWDISREQEARTLLVKDEPRAVAFGPDGSYLVTAGKEGVITIWDQVTGRPIRMLRGHTDSILSVVILPGGRRIASASMDRTVRVWDVATGALIHTLGGHTAEVSDVAFSPDGKTLASASNDRTVKLWDADAGGEPRTLNGHIDVVRSVAFGKDGKILASSGDDGFVLVWDPATGRRLRAIQAGPDEILDIAISPDGRWLASGDAASTIKVWEIASGKEVQVLRGHAGAIEELTFSPDGRRLVSASDDRTVRIWDAASGRELLVFRAHADGVWGVAFSPDGGRIASAGRDGAIKLWEADAGPRPPQNP
jgi:WD40 repeat protein